jgi:hypothetical protein
MQYFSSRTFFILAGKWPTFFADLSSFTGHIPSIFLFFPDLCYLSTLFSFEYLYLGVLKHAVPLEEYCVYPVFFSSRGFS